METTHSGDQYIGNIIRIFILKILIHVFVLRKFPCSCFDLILYEKYGSCICIMFFILILTP
jgi:hypothetical protein